MSNIIPINEQRPVLSAGGRPMAIVPQTMDEAYRLGKAICLAGMAPKGMDTPEKAMIAIMRGMEVGLTPMQAMDKIAIVNGRPTIFGDGAIGLVRGSGLCEWVNESIEGEGDARVALCEVKRKGEPRAIARTFSVADAKKANLWGKDGPWQQYPERMLQMRARAFALRDGFADVLGGMYLREEIEDASDRSSPPAQRMTAPPPPPAEIDASPASAPALTHEPQAAPDHAAMIDAAIAKAAAAQSEDELDAAMDPVHEIVEGVSLADRNRIQNAYEDNLARLRGQAPAVIPTDDELREIARGVSAAMRAYFVAASQPVKERMTAMGAELRQLADAASEAGRAPPPPAEA